MVGDKKTMRETKGESFHIKSPNFSKVSMVTISDFPVVSCKAVFFQR